MQGLPSQVTHTYTLSSFHTCSQLGWRTHTKQRTHLGQMQARCTNAIHDQNGLQTGAKHMSVHHPPLVGSMLHAGSAGPKPAVNNKIGGVVFVGPTGDCTITRRHTKL